MKKIALFLCMTLIWVQPCFAKFEQIKGEWKAFSRSSNAIYGRIVFSENFVRWGVTLVNDNIDLEKPLPCNAEYSYSFDQSTNLHKVALKNKVCDYENMANSHISRDIESWHIEIIEEGTRRLEAKFFDFNESGTQLGWGVFYKYFHKE